MLPAIVPDSNPSAEPEPALPQADGAGDSETTRETQIRDLSHLQISPVGGFAVMSNSGGWISTKTILLHRDNGSSVEEIARGHGLTPEQVRAALHFEATR